MAKTQSNFYPIITSEVTTGTHVDIKDPVDNEAVAATIAENQAQKLVSQQPNFAVIRLDLNDKNHETTFGLVGRSSLTSSAQADLIEDSFYQKVIKSLV